MVPKLSYDAMKEYRREEKAVKQSNENPNERGRGDVNQNQVIMLQQKKRATL